MNQDLAYSLRCQTKRTDIPTDVVRSLSEAYQALQDVAYAVSEMEAMLIEQRAEVKRLRAELKTSNAERDEARLGLLQESGEDMSTNQPICKTCGVLWVDHMGIQGTCAENAKLRKERDEARREVCRLMSMFNTENSVQIAASRSWDCFKETL